MSRADAYPKGSKWRVVAPGARLWGMQPVGNHNAQQGWGRALAVGEVITSLGTAWTFGDGVPALKWGGPDGEWLANDCLFEPTQGGMWGGQAPADGYLEPVR